MLNDNYNEEGIGLAKKMYEASKELLLEHELDWLKTFKAEDDGFFTPVNELIYGVSLAKEISIDVQKLTDSPVCFQSDAPHFLN